VTSSSKLNTENSVMDIEKLGKKVSADIISVEPADGDETINISFPYGEGKISKLRWAITIPIVFPLCCTLFDVRKYENQKYYGLTFIGSIIWLGIFSFLMV